MKKKVKKKMLMLMKKKMQNEKQIVQKVFVVMELKVKIHIFRFVEEILSCFGRKDYASECYDHCYYDTNYCDEDWFFFEVGNKYHCQRNVYFFGLANECL